MRVGDQTLTLPPHNRSCTAATGVPVIGDFDSWSRVRSGTGHTEVEDVVNGTAGGVPRVKGRGQAFSEGVGWLSIAYTPEDGRRSSASVAYVHPSAFSSLLLFLSYHGSSN